MMYVCMSELLPRRQPPRQRQVAGWFLHSLASRGGQPRRCLSLPPTSVHTTIPEGRPHPKPGRDTRDNLHGNPRTRGRGWPGAALAPHQGLLWLRFCQLQPTVAPTTRQSAIIAIICDNPQHSHHILLKIGNVPLMSCVLFFLGLPTIGLGPHSPLKHTNVKLQICPSSLISSSVWTSGRLGSWRLQQEPGSGPTLPTLSTEAHQACDCTSAPPAVSSAARDVWTSGRLDVWTAGGCSRRLPTIMLWATAGPSSPTNSDIWR